MGGSSGGGGSSGAVSYPAYMETQHEAWLTDLDTLITAAVSASPYASAVAYNPDCVLNATNVILSQFNDVVIALDPTTDWSTYYDAIVAKYTADTFTTLTEYTFTDPFDDAEIAADIATHDAEVATRITNDVLPAFKVGMQNINAVMTSAFTIGSALISAQGLRDTNSHASTIRLANQRNKLEYENTKANSRNLHNTNLLSKDKLSLSQKLSVVQFGLSGADLLIKAKFQESDLYKAISGLTIDANRIKIIAKSEQTNQNYSFDERDVRWGLDMYKDGAVMMASVSGGVPAADVDTNKMASALGGAASGAGAGASFGPWGAVIGGVIGGIAGLL